MQELLNLDRRKFFSMNNIRGANKGIVLKYQEKDQKHFTKIK